MICGNSLNGVLHVQCISTWLQPRVGEVLTRLVKPNPELKGTLTAFQGIDPEFWSQNQRNRHQSPESELKHQPCNRNQHAKQGGGLTLMPMDTPHPRQDSGYVWAEQPHRLGGWSTGRVFLVSVLSFGLAVRHVGS